MKVILQFQVSCTQCYRKENFNATIMFRDHINARWNDAQNYFERLGWQQLPSGTWTCGNSHQSAFRNPHSAIEKEALA